MPEVKDFILSDESVNSYGFKVLTSGIDLTDFNQNPVLLFNHNPDSCIGNWKDVRIDGTQLKGKPNFDEKDPQALLIQSKVENGFVKGASIGFQILRVERSYNEQGDDTPVVTKSRLMEVSLTPLPSNKNALRLYDVEGALIPDEQIQKYLTLNIQNQNPNIMNKLKFALVALMSSLVTGMKLSDTDSDEQFVDAIKSVLSKKDTEIEGLKDELKKLKEAGEATQLQRVKELIADAVKEGRILAADIAKWEDRANKDFEMAKETLSLIPAKIDINTKLSTGADNKNEKKTGEDRKDWTIEDWQQKDTAGLSEMIKNDHEKYVILFEKQYGVKPE